MPKLRNDCFSFYSIIYWLTGLAMGANKYQKLANTNVGSVMPSLTIYNHNLLTGCLLECNSRPECNLVTHTLPNKCDLYFVLEANTCITSYTTIPGCPNTNLYIKTRKKLNQTCKSSNQCQNEFGLVCLNGLCACSDSL